MTAKTRIYILKNNNGDTVALIRAATRAQALAHFARRSFAADLPSQDELMTAVLDGHEVTDADADTLAEAA